MTLNNKQATIVGLNRLGWTVDHEARTAKYLVFQHADKVLKLRFLVGKSGAFRRALTGTVARSISLTDGKMHKALQAVGRAPSHWVREQYEALYRGVVDIPEAHQVQSVPEVLDYLRELRAAALTCSI